MHGLMQGLPSSVCDPCYSDVCPGERVQVTGGRGDRHAVPAQPRHRARCALLTVCLLFKPLLLLLRRPLLWASQCPCLKNISSADGCISKSLRQVSWLRRRPEAGECAAQVHRQRLPRLQLQVRPPGLNNSSIILCSHASHMQTTARHALRVKLLVPCMLSSGYCPVKISVLHIW
jgi:hypothetical protein